MEVGVTNRHIIFETIYVNCHKFLNLFDVKNLKCIKNAFAEGKMNGNFNGKRKEGDEKTP